MQGRRGDLPEDPEQILADLLAPDLRVVGVKPVNATVLRLDLEHGGRRFRAKWKPLGPGASEVQEGYEGNNAPRCEVGAWRLNRLLFGHTSTAHHLVAPVVVRALHRDVPCSRACAAVPRLAQAGPATFPAYNDHLVLGALTWWIDGVASPERFAGGLWDPRRFERNASYRRSFSDLCLFLYLIAHGDANYADNFLARVPESDRLYSIDNGRAFDGVSFYTGEGDPDWQPFAELAPGRLVAPMFAPQTVRRVATLQLGELHRALRVTAAVDLVTGMGSGAREAPEVPALERLAGSPLEGQPGVTRIGRGAFIAMVAGRPWLLLGIGEQGLRDVASRARALTTAIDSETGRPRTPPAPPRSTK
jgi:hypothetical protein